MGEGVPQGWPRWRHVPRSARDTRQLACAHGQHHAEIADITGHGVYVLDKHYLCRDGSLGDNAITKLESGTDIPKRAPKGPSWSMRKDGKDEQRQVAGGLGFEPRLAESESAVLPLDDPPPIADMDQWVDIFNIARIFTGRSWHV